MTVSVNQPQRKDSDLDTLSKALNIATTIYGVKMNSDQAKAAEEIAKQSQIANSAAKDQAATESSRKESVAALEGKTPVFGRPKDGDFIPREMLPRQAGLSLPEGSIGLTSAGKNNQYERLKTEIATDKLLYQREIRGEQKNKIANESVRKLSERIEKSGISELVTSLKKLDQSMPGGINGSEADGDIPGIGGAANAANLPVVGEAFSATLSEAGKKTRQLVANVRNSILKARSGGSVTKEEAERLLEELGTGVFKTDNDLRRGMSSVKDIITDRLALIESGSDPDILHEYRSRKGSLTTEDPFFDFGGGGSFASRQRPQQPGGFGTANAARPAPGETQFDPDAFLRK